MVAIIDSGLDVHHEVLKISDPSKAKYQTEAALEEAKEKAGIDYGKWYNNKVVYAYNYIDGDDNIKEKNSYSHGMHVTGITAEIPTRKLLMMSMSMVLRQKLKLCLCGSSQIVNAQLATLSISKPLMMQ